MLLHNFDFLLLVSGFVVTLAAVPLMIKLASRYGVVDVPHHRKIHRQAVPYLGGAAVLLGVTAAFLCGLFSSPFSATSLLKAVLILGASGLAMGLGLLDDKFHIQARQKFLGQLLIAGFFVFFGFRFEIIHVPFFKPFHLASLGFAFTTLWMLTVVNAINLIDGMDGLASSVSAAILLCLAVCGVALGDGAVASLAFTGLGAVLAFLVYNWKPAKIYLGDAGSLCLGMLIAASSVALHQDAFYRFGGPKAAPAEAFPYQVTALSLICFYPLLEVFLSVARRSLRGKSIGSADKGHIHHRLMAQGWNAPWVAFAAAGLSMICGELALCLVVGDRLLAGVLAAVGCGVFAVGLHFCGYLDIFLPERVRKLRPQFLMVNHFMAMQKIKLGLCQHSAELLPLIDQACFEFGILHYSLEIKARAGSALEHHWDRPKEAQSNYSVYLRTRGMDELKIFSDSVELPGSQGKVSWIFEPHPDEEDLEVEYWVLMSEFMKEALEKVVQLSQKQEPGQGAASPPEWSMGSFLSSHLLKRRARLSGEEPPQTNLQASS